MTTKQFFYIFLFFSLLSFSSCVTYTVPGSNTDLSAMYNPGKTSLHPEFSVQVQSDTTANLLIRVLRDEILFSRANAENKLKGAISIHCRVYSDKENKQIFDSITVRREVVFTRNPVVISVIKLRVQPGKQHNVQLWVKDTKRFKSYKGYTSINNTPEYWGHRYYSTLYSLKSKGSLQETMNFYTWVPDSFGTKVYSVNNTPQPRYVSCYWKERPLPKLPYLDIRDTLVLKPDTTVLLNENRMVLRKPGFYFFRRDTLQQQGMGVIKTKEYFPNLKTSSILIDPLAYLCTPEEFEEIKQKKNKKLAVDEFWMHSARDYTKAKQLIRVYYNRTKYANIYFSSVSEGWKTDRGMIFVLLGPPEKVYRTPKGERWIYGGTAKFRRIQFDFEKVQNPYSNNHYILLRKTDHRSIWRSALKSWRNGKIYNGEEPLANRVYASSEDIR